MLNGRREPVSPGECLLIPMWQEVVGRHQREVPFVVLWAVFALYNEDGSPADLRQPQYENYTYPLRRYLPDTPFFQRLLERLLAGSDAREQQDYLQVLLRELRYQDSFVHTRGMEPEVFRAVHGLCAAIRNDPGEAWTVQRMADSLHYSADHFSRLFMQATGQRPQDFLIGQRIAAAQAMLGFSSRPVAQIANLLGYCDVYHFCRQFKQKTGMTPLQMRRAKRS